MARTMLLSDLEEVLVLEVHMFIKRRRKRDGGKSGQEPIVVAF